VKLGSLGSCWVVCRLDRQALLYSTYTENKNIVHDGCRVFALRWSWDEG
jgi:hypothetical protein